MDIFLNKETIKKAKQSTGKSGSFFFFSYDKKFILKTISIRELESLLKLLPSYYDYICFQNSFSLLSRIYGAFSINIGGMSTIHLFLMENTLSELKDVIILFDIYIKTYFLLEYHESI